MKYLKLFLAVVIASVLSLSSCKEATKAPEKEPQKEFTIEDLATPSATTVQNPAAMDPPQNALGVWHYTCSQGCAGGAGTATNCATCGGLLAHNTSYHAQANPTPNLTAQPATAPSQNAAGIWHFSCAKGCTGGSGTAGNCTTCGDALAHNQAYHQ
jgi:hypothetical protein